MGHAEEDKELMMIRMETLKTMIGKLKTKTTQNTAKENSQSSSSTDEKTSKGYFDQTKTVTTTRPIALSAPVSPSPIISKNNKSCLGTSTPPSPSQPKRSPKRIDSTNTSTLQKHKTKHNLAPLLNSASQLSSSVSILVPSATTSSINHSISDASTVTSLPLSATSLKILKINSLIQIPKEKSMIQATSDVTEGKTEGPTTVAKVVDQPSLNKNSCMSNSTVGEKSSNLTSCSKEEVFKPLTTSSKSYSDSEILLRKNLPKKYNNYKDCIPTACRSENGSVSSSVNSCTARPASTGPAEVSLVNNHTRPSSLLLNCSPIPSAHKSTHPTKTSDHIQEHNSSSKVLQKSAPMWSTIETNMKHVKPASRPATRTVTQPDKHKKTRTKTPDLKKSNNTISSSSVPPTGKVLFERTGKILFDRHAQNKTQFQAPNVKNISSNQKSRTKSTANFAHEFQLIRERHASSHVNTTRTKFFSTEYVPPEMSKKAQVILSKYKVVRNKEHSTTPTHNSKRKDRNATYSQARPTSSSNVAHSPGKILFQRYRPRYAGDYTTLYSSKGKRHLVTKTSRKPYKNFVSRRIKYIKRVDPDPFSMQVKPHVAVSGSPNAKATKELILSRHGTNYKVAGNLKSLRRLSSEKGHKSKATYTRPIIHHSKHHLSRFTSKLNARSVSAKQYVASQVLKKTIVQTARKKVTKEKYCLFYNRFGKCKRGNQCNFIHDADKIAICTRFLRGTCKDESCLFSHKLDPDKMPVCSYFLRGECSRDNCPYRHVKVSQSASVCDEFLQGYCPRGKECTRKHILECEEFITTGSCSKGKSCLLTHRQGKVTKRKNSGSRAPKGLHEKRKKDEDSEVCQIIKENENNSESERSRHNKAKKHKLPKFVSEKIKLLRESTSGGKPASFAGVKKLIESTTPTDKTSPEEDAKSTSSKDDFWNSDFIPLSNYSGGESEDEDSEFIQRMFTFK